MKPVMVILHVFVFAGTALPARHDWEHIKLPDTRDAIYGGMTVKQFVQLLPRATALRLEDIDNGRTLGFAELSYPLEMNFHDMELVSLSVRNVAPKSKFARWLRKTIDRMPRDNVEHDSGSSTRDGKEVLYDKWESPGATWSSYANSMSGYVSLYIAFKERDSVDPKRIESKAGSEDAKARAKPGGQPDTLFEQAPQPIPEFSPQPTFPELAKEAHISRGQVVAKLFIDTTGVVRNWEFVKVEPIGYGFAQAVERVIPAWRFTPAYQQGVPVAVWVALPFTFKSR